MKVRRSWIWVGLIAFVMAVAFFLLRGGETTDGPVPVAQSTTTVPSPVEIVAPPPPAPDPVPTPVTPPTPKKAQRPVEPLPKDLVPTTPAPIEIFKELIPKDIDVVRVYYASPLSGPGSRIDFDINGSGFTREFEKMIVVESGHPKISVSGLRLVTPNQIHGQLVVPEDVPTSINFPQILIDGKVVFRAPEPFGIIRPGEVLNLTFTEMGESGRTGRFRIYTNLTEKMFEKFSVTSDTNAIAITDVTPSLPFIVDATIHIGPAALGGAYGMTIALEGKPIWERDGVIRIVRPNVGEHGLVQRAQAVDGFHRPGETARFWIQGSGFQPTDVDLLSVRVPSMDVQSSTIVFISPGRMELRVPIPSTAEVGVYSLHVMIGTETLVQLPTAFQIVEENWLFGVRVDPALVPGGSSSMFIDGRGLTKSFVLGIGIGSDEPGLRFENWEWKTAHLAAITVSASTWVVPGDYLLTLTRNGDTLQPLRGSIIRVNEKQPEK